MFATQADPIGQIDCDLQNIIICRSNNKCMIKNKKLMEPSYLNVNATGGFRSDFLNIF